MTLDANPSTGDSNLNSMQQLTPLAALGFTFVGGVIGFIAGLFSAGIYGLCSSRLWRPILSSNSRCTCLRASDTEIQREIRDKVTELVQAISSEKGVVDGQDSSKK